MNPDQLLAHFDKICDAPNAVPRFRRFILDLIVQGRIVPGSDEPKADHWQQLTLGDCSTIINGRAYKQQELLASGTPVIRIQNLNGGGSWYYSDLILDANKYCDNGDLLYAWSGTFGPYIWHGPLGIFHYHIWKLILNENVDKRFMFYLLQQLTVAIKEEAHGLMLPHMTKQRMEQWPVSLPPLVEQHRIVAKVDELMALCDQLEAAQAKRENRRDRLNAASLHRLNQPDADLDTFREHARFHLSNLTRLTTRSDQVKELRQTILNLAVKGSLWSNKVEPSQIVPLHQVAHLQNGYAFKSEWFVKSGIRLLRNVNIGHGHVRWDEVECLSVDRFAEFERFSLAREDIVLSLDRPFIVTGTKVARVRSQDLPCLLLQRVGRFVIDESKISPDYLYIWLQSPHFNQQIDPGRSNGVPHISSKQVESADIYLPDLNEQLRVVDLVDRLMALCDQLEAQLTIGQTERSRLLEAILHEALKSSREEATQVDDLSQSDRQPALVFKTSPSADEKDTKANAHFKRAVLAAEIVHQLHAEPTFGHVKFMKVFELCELEADITDLETQYYREAAGPLDRKALYSIDAQLRKQRWYAMERIEGRIVYEPMEKSGSHSKYYHRYFGDKDIKIHRVINLLKPLDTRHCEIIATIYTAWNDLILAGNTKPEPNAIINEATTEWHADKVKIDAKLWNWGLTWMSENQMIPRGTGKATKKKIG